MRVMEAEPTQQELVWAIALKQKEMIELGVAHGLTDIRTVQCSQQLDYLLNLYKREKGLKPTG